MPLIINHKNRHNVNISLDYNEIEQNHYFMKKWWLNHIFKDENGNDLEFRGFINTIALKESDFPETLEGTFWMKADESTIYKDKQMSSGFFDIGFGEYKNYVIGSVYPIYLIYGLNYKNNPSRTDAEFILKANEPILTFPYFEAKIEDCLDLKLTYIDKIEL